MCLQNLDNLCISLYQPSVESRSAMNVRQMERWKQAKKKGGDGGRQERRIQLIYSDCLAHTQLSVSSLTPRRPGVVHACNPGTEEVEAAGSEIQGHPRLHLRVAWVT